MLNHSHISSRGLFPQLLGEVKAELWDVVLKHAPRPIPLAHRKGKPKYSERAYKTIAG